MSEQEKKSGGGSTAPLVVVEQTTASRHKPIRADQEEATDLHRKHSKVPVVGTVAEESKVSSAQDPECDHAMSTEKQKQSMSKKFSSVTSKRGPSMETITLAPMEIETKRDAPSSHQQPIPPSVEIVASHSDNQVEDKQETQLEKKADTDSITDEIKELRTPDATKKHSEWANGDNERYDENSADISTYEHATKIGEMAASSSATKKKEISWEDEEYLRKVHVRDMGVRSQVWMLEGKASIGPCFRELAPNVGPSGILICVPKKYPKHKCETAGSNPIPSVVNINVLKKYLPTKSKSQTNHNTKAKKAMDINEGHKTEEHIPCGTFFGEFRSKLENITCKIINVFNI